MSSISEQAIRDLKLQLDSINNNTVNNARFTIQHCCKENCSKVHNRFEPNLARFLINLFEPPSYILRKGITPDKPNVHHEPEKNKQKTFHRENDKNNTYDKFCNRDSDIHETSFAMAELLDLKARRNIECLKMTEASKVLQLLYCQSPYGDWSEKLLVEKILLESRYKFDMLTKKIQNNDNHQREVQIGTISVSDFKFYLNKLQRNSRETDFFILLVSSDMDVKITEITRPTNGEIIFREKFVFPFDKKFCLKLRLYGITMSEMPKLAVTKLFMKNPLKHDVCKLQYKNFNTSDIEEKRVLKSSFKLCGETEIVPSKLKSWKLNLEPNSLLREFCIFSVTIENFRIHNNCSGFLTLGYKCKDVIVWDRCWCILEDSLLKIYNSPSEVDSRLVLNLNECLLDKIVVAPRTLCNRAKSLMLDINAGDDTINRYFLMADSKNDLERWLTNLNLVLDLLRFRDDVLCSC